MGYAPNSRYNKKHHWKEPLPLYKFFLLVSTLQDILLVSTLQDILLVSTLSRYTFGFYPSRYTFGFYPSRYTFGFYLSLISRYTLVSTFQVLPLVTTLNSYFRLLYFYIIQFFTVLQLWISTFELYFLYLLLVFTVLSLFYLLVLSSLLLSLQLLWWTSIQIYSLGFPITPGLNSTIWFLTTSKPCVLKQS